MADFIRPLVDNAIAILKAKVAAHLPQNKPDFRQHGRIFTGVVLNFPAVWVQPVRTDFDEDSDHSRHQAHQIKIKIGLSAADPEELAKDALDYVRAVDLALTASEPKSWENKLPSGVVMRTWVAAHDYGQVFEAGAGALARFPELDLIVETEETL